MTRIMVVEDNPATMKSASLILHSAGHSVLPAVDAETGAANGTCRAARAESHGHSAAGLDSLAATAILKQDPATAAIPSIALSALVMKADEERSQTAGCDADIIKPLRHKELYAVMQRSCQKDRCSPRRKPPGICLQPERAGHDPHRR